jgi:beta-lactamase superfamily II metal-dependent hydrolase
VKLIFYQAECGDATRIEFTGSDRKLHHILIDTGFERTYRHVLEQDIRALAESGNEIDLCIISHIHDDHIGGAIAYVRGIQNGTIGDIVKQWIYNPPRGRNIEEKRSIREISSAKSIAQGDLMASYLIANNKLSANDITDKFICPDLFGLKLTFLSPNQKTLKALRKKYPAGRRNPFEREELADISLAKAKVKNDYHLPLKDFSLDNTGEDNSVENGSSISVLVDHNGRKFLNLADAHPSVITSSLKNIGFSKSNPLVCDWVKVAHHGSKGNNLSLLYELILCNNFIVSVNGENKYQLPSKQCLATIIRGPHRTATVCNLYFTYDNTTLQGIFKIDGDKIFDEFNFKVHYSNHPCLSFEI